jgi:opacity protein-like surface antigen
MTPIIVVRSGWRALAIAAAAPLAGLPVAALAQGGAQQQESAGQSQDTQVPQPVLAPADVVPPASAHTPPSPPPAPAPKATGLRPPDARDEPYKSLVRRLDALENIPSNSCVTPEEQRELDAIKAEVEAMDDALRAAQATGAADKRALIESAALHDHIRDVERHMAAQATFCPAPTPRSDTHVPQPSLPPAEVIPPRDAPPSRARLDVAGFYGGLGADYFKENGVDIGLVHAIAGYRFGRFLGAEVEFGGGVIDEEDSSGSFHDSIGITYTVIPAVVGHLPVAPGVEVFARGGYGVTRFKSSFSSTSGGSTSGGSASSSEGTAAIGGGAEFRVGDRGSVRFEYTRLEFDNGTGADRVGATYIFRFGRR